MATMWSRATFYSEKPSRMLLGRPLRLNVLVSLFLFLCGAAFLFRSHYVALPPSPPAELKELPPPHPELLLSEDAPRCGNPVVDILKDKAYDISAKIRYSRVCIKPVYTSNFDASPLAVANLTTPSAFIPSDMHPIELSHCIPSQLENLTSACDTTIKLPVPRPYTAPPGKYSDFLFAVSTTFSRLQDSRSEFRHWLGGTDARLVAAITESADITEAMMHEEEARYTRDGMNLTLIRPRNETDRTAQVHFVMIEDLVADHLTPETKWVGILDDDTFFPSLAPLADAFSAYNPDEEWYLGALSEIFTSVAAFGYNAFGGAGIYLSAPLAKKIGPLARDCLAEPKHNGDVPLEGDVLFAECIYHHTSTKLTIVPGLWQMDIHGNVAGFFESGRKMLNLHHWKSWFNLPVVSMAYLATLCGDCFMHRWRVGRNEVFTAGFSIAQYPGAEGTEDIDLGLMEDTFKGRHDYDFSIGPFRPKLEKEAKKSYVIIGGEEKIDEDGKLRQVYVHKADRKQGEWDEVIDVIWEAPDSEGWRFGV